ncbi:MAG: hypothetical protein ACR2N6_03115 [Miltoncostaeaceae bacterium]
MRWRWILLGGAAILVLVAVAGVGLFLLADADAGAVSPERALTEFRDDPGVVRDPAGGVPPAGVYLFRVAGEETLSRGPLTITRTFPDLAPRTITHTETGFDVNWRLSTGKGELSHISLADESTVTTYAESYFAAAGITFTNTRAWTPPTTRALVEPKVGDRWSGRHTDGEGLMLDSESEVTGMRTLRIGGMPVRTAVVESSFTVSGTATGSGSSTSFYDPESALNVRTVTQSDLSQDGSAKTRYVATLTSLDPLT